MISKAALLAWAALLPVLHDGHGAPIPRPRNFFDVVVPVALEHPEIDARILVATLDVVAAHESGYRHAALGDGGKSKGAWQTPVAETPDDPTGQARVALKWIAWSMQRCPDHPLSLYATGRICGAVRIADFYFREVRAELAVAVPEVP